MIKRTPILMYAEDTERIHALYQRVSDQNSLCYQRKVESALYVRKPRTSLCQHHLHQKFHLSRLLGPIGLTMTDCLF